MKSYFIQIITGTLFYLAFGWLVFDSVIGKFTEENTTQIHGFKKSAQEFNYLFLAVSCCAYACLITYIVSHLKRTKSLLQGFYIAAIVGMLVAIMTDSYWYASSHFYSNLKVVLADVLAAGITVGALGAFTVWTANLSSGNV